jgi:hypothetical protein
MVYDNKAMEPMTEFDWLVVGGHEYRKDGKPTLPRRRWFLPIPPSIDGLHVLAHRMAGASEQLHMMAREGRMVGKHSYALGQAARLLFQMGQDFEALKRDWERELLEAEGKEKAAAETGEQLRVVR